ncbi:MAG: TIM barrel protein [Anaerolineaceae bacterium]|nr:TIM barrel protein [Anaerolineaceae bacterium]
MQNIKFASPLYILREQCAVDLFSVLRKLKDIGFDGVEFLGFFGHGADEVRRCLDEIEFHALGNHVSYQSFLQDINGTLDFHATVGCGYITISNLGESGFPGSPNWGQTLAGLIKIGEEAQKYGITLLYHNHDHELIDHIDGHELLDAILSSTPKQVLSFEPDLGWIEIGGGNCEYYLTRYVDRCPVIHLKDYYSSDRSKHGFVRDFLPQRGNAERGYFEFRPTGYGVLNLARLMPLCLSCAPEWFVMDHDLAYERDSFADLKLSLDYVKTLMALY